MSIALASLTAMVALSGLLFSSLYQDSDAIKSIWFVNDLITLLIAVPLMVLSMNKALKGSLHAYLVWIGSLWYLIYNYLFYLYGAQFNAFFLLYVILLSLSAYTLIMSIRLIDINDLAARVINPQDNKKIQWFLIFFAVALGLPWVALALNFKLTSEVPSFDLTVIFATDLVFLVSVLIFGAMLLKNDSPWGILVSAMILFKGVLYPMVLLIGGVRLYFTEGDWDPFNPLYAVLWLLCIYFYRLLIKNIK